MCEIAGGVQSAGHRRWRQAGHGQSQAQVPRAPPAARRRKTSFFFLFFSDVAICSA